MRNGNAFIGLWVAGIMLVACGERRDEPPTAPNLASTAAAAIGCDFTTIKKQVRAEFTVTADANFVLSLVQSMNGYYPGTPAQATYVGFQILDQIATKGVTEGTPPTGSDLTNSVLACMSVGSVSLPLNFTSALSPTGAYSVRGWTGSAASFSAPDDRPVTSRDLNWVLEVPTCATPPNTTPTCSPDGSPLNPGTGQYSWTTFPASGTRTRTGITTLGNPAGLPDTVKGLFLTYGQPGSGANFVGSGDALIVGIFDWKTIPTASFTPGAIVGECTRTNFLQHNFAGQGGEILGYVFPFCPSLHLGARESAPQSLVEWAWHALAPTPAHAALVLGGGSGTKTSALSPWGVVNPGHVNLVFDPQALYKAPNQVGQPLKDNKGNLLQVTVTSDGGTAFKQATVFVWIEASNNQGVNVLVCNNWAYTNDHGVALFKNAYLNKAGGYILTFKTVGTAASRSAPGTPPTSAGQQPTSALFNVKNGTAPNDNGCSISSPINAFVNDPNVLPTNQVLPPPPGPPPIDLNGVPQNP